MSFFRNSARWLLDRSRESFQLLQRGVRAPPGQWQHLLVEQAPHNRTALSLLKTQKEWNDLRYYGIVQYVRQKGMLPLLSSSSASSGSSSTTSTNVLRSSPFSTTATTGDVSTDASSSASTSTATTTTTTTPAKVAFMVTGRMKSQLAELGYTAAQVKALTPVEASLLIDHAVSPDDQMEQLPRLVQAYEAQQQAAEQAAAAQSIGDATSGAAGVTTTTEPTPNENTTTTTTTTTENVYTPPPRSPRSGPSLTETLLGSIASKNVMDQPTSISSRSHLPSFSSAREWYEVVEEYHAPANTTTSANHEVVALHSTEEEAQLDANLRLEIMTKRAQEQKKNIDVQYSIRKTLR